MEKLILTASGGPFLRKKASEFASITVEEALKHPTWSMGPKITIDSATLGNKALEVIEAHFLFGFPAGSATVDWQRLTLTPWWKNDDWRLSAEIPWLMRDATATGTVLVWRRVGGVWTQVPLTVSATQSDSGIGDVVVAATRSWDARAWLSPYVTADVKTIAVAANPGAGMKLGDFLFVERIAAAVTKGNTSLVGELNKSLAAIMADGTYQKISTKWFNEDIRCK